jgi:hypothetical protein
MSRVSVLNIIKVLDFEQIYHEESNTLITMRGFGGGECGRGEWGRDGDDGVQHTQASSKQHTQTISTHKQAAHTTQAAHTSKQHTSKQQATHTSKQNN